MKIHLSPTVAGFLVVALTCTKSIAAEPEPATAEAAPEQAAVEYQVENQHVVAVSGETRTVLSVPEPVLAVHHTGTRLYVARGAAGVAVYDVSQALVPVLVREVPLAGGGSATGFNVVEGQLWVMVVSRGAIPIEDGVTTAAPVPERAPGADTKTPTSKDPPPEAEPGESRAALSDAPVALRKVSPGTVELATGTNDGVRVGDRFAIFRGTRVAEEGVSGFSGEEIIALAEIVAVKPESALAEVSRSAEVYDTDLARPARRDQTESNAYPPRVANVGEASAVLRPIVNAGSPLGVGVLADLAASFWGNAYFAGVRVQPLGLGWTEDGSIISTTALLEGGYDGRAFAVGLGAGMSWVNGDADYMLRGYSRMASDAGDPTREETQETHSAFTLSQLARLGARDGFNLTLHNLFILHSDDLDDRSGFIYGGTTGKLTVPVERRSDLFIEGGGGVMGYWFFGAGVATWIVGNGSPGSWKLSISAGAAGIWGSREVTETFPASNGQPGFTNTYTDEIDVAGPMVSVGLTRRFGW